MVLSELFVVVIRSLALALALVWVYSYSVPLLRRYPPRAQAVAQGIIFGLFGLLAVTTADVLVEGFRLTGRHGLVAMSSVFGGPVSAVVTTIIICLYPFAASDPNALVFILPTITTALLGIFCHYRGRGKPTRVRILWLFLLGVVIAIQQLAWLALLGTHSPQDLATIIAPALFLFYPFGTALVGGLFIYQQRGLESQRDLEQERYLLRTLIDQLPDYIFVKDASLRFTASNIAHARAVKITDVDDMIGKTAAQLFPPELAESFEADDRRVLESGEPLINAERITTDAAGRQRWVLTTKVPFRDQDGKIAGLVGISHDVTERKRAEERFRSLLEAAPDAMVIVNNQGHIVLINEQTQRLFGYSAAELLGQSVEILIPERFHRSHIGNRSGFLANPPTRGMGVGLELYGARKDGTEFPVEVSLSPLETEEGVLVSSAIRDITRRKQVEQALRNSEEQFRSAFDYAAIGMALVGLDGRWLKVNRALCEIVGYTPEELLPKTFQDITHPDDLEADLSYVRQILDGQIKTYQMEKRYFHKLGYTVWVLLSVSLVRDSDGRPIHFISQIQDITLRKRVEAALTEERNLLRTLLDHLPDNVFVKDAEGRFIMINDSHTSSTGKTTEDVLGRTSLDIFPAELAAQFHADDMLVLKTGQPLISVERPMADPQNRERWGLTTKIPLRDQDGQIIGLVGIIRDITERKKAEKQAMELALQKENMQVLADFIRDVSHDLRTPLTVIQSSLYLLLRSPDAERRAQHAASIEQQIARLERLIDDQLMMVRLDSSAEFAFERVDLNRAAREATASVAGLAEDQKLTLTQQLDDSLPPVRADEEKLLRALHNLVENAITYTPQGGSVTVRTYANGTQAIFEVQDSGIGIAESDLSRIFERFYRADKARSTRTGGSGLGLPIVRKIIEAHGGQIEVESAVGVGSTFRARLPLAANDEGDRR